MATLQRLVRLPPCLGLQPLHCTWVVAMKLEPVYLVAPKRVPSMPTRRAFLIAGGTFVLGSGLGGACGYAMGARPVDANGKATEGGVPVEAELEKSGDVELDELRRLAVKAPIAELLERRVMFVVAATKLYRTDAVVWKGIARMSDAILSTPSIVDRRVTAQYLAQEIERSDPKVRDQLIQKAADLRKIK